MATVSSVPEAAQRFLQGSAKGLWIDNAYVDAVGERRPSPRTTPRTARSSAWCRRRRPPTSTAAVKAAARRFEGEWSALTPATAAALMYKLADLIEENIDELATLETLDNGKPIRDARARRPPARRSMFRYYAGWADKIHGQTIPVRPATSSPTPAASRSASSARSSPGTSRC